MPEFFSRYRMRNVISIDLEQWFHRPIFRNHVSVAEQRDRQHITRTTEIILQILKKHNKQTTFFVVAEIAEQAPEIVEEISKEGHEIAFHGYKHLELHRLDKGSFDKEVKAGIRIIKRVAKEEPRGFRAPVFSMNRKTSWALQTLIRHGFAYDSSVVPAKTPLYGNLASPYYPYYPSLNDPSKEDRNQNEIVEFPPLTRRVFFVRLPTCGFSSRIFGINFVLKAIRKMNREGFPSMLYFHPWELCIGPKRHLKWPKSWYAHYRVPFLRDFHFLIKNVEMDRADHVLENYNFIT